MEHQPHFLSEPLPQLLLSEVPSNSSEGGVPAFLLLFGSLALRGTLPLCCSISGDSDCSSGWSRTPEEQSNTFPQL